MQIFIALALGIFLISCGDKHVPTTHQEPNKIINSQTSVDSKTTPLPQTSVEGFNIKLLSGFEVYLELIDNRAIKIKSLPEITAKLKIREYQRMLTIYTLKRLGEICEEMKFRTQALQITNYVDSSIQTNPYSSDVIRPFLDRMYPGRELEIEGDFVTKSVDAEVLASYLTDQEIDELELWIEKNYQETEGRVRLLSEALAMNFPDRGHILNKYSRLICGLVTSEASMNLTLHASDGRVLLVKISEVTF